MKKTIHSILCALSITIFTPQLAIADNFVTEDIPAMEKMFVGDTVELDALNGSITNTITSTPSKPQEIKAYYAYILPNLGWRKTSVSTYDRDNQTLKIIVLESDSDGTTVEFSLLSQ